MFAIIRTRWQTGPLSRRAKRRSSAAPGSLRKKYAGIFHPPNMVRLPINSTISGDHWKPVLNGPGFARQVYEHVRPRRISEAFHCSLVGILACSAGVFEGAEEAPPQSPVLFPPGRIVRG